MDLVSQARVPTRMECVEERILAIGYFDGLNMDRS
jgi:hypothetical protein